MNPSTEKLKEWAEDMGDGWTRVPTSAWDGVLWILGICEELERQEAIAELIASSAAASGAAP